MVTAAAIDPEGPASQKARTALVLSLQAGGIVDEEKQRHVCRVWARRWIASRTELTEREARSLAARLREIGPAGAARVLDMPGPARPALVDPPQAGPVAVDPVACLASWDEPAGEPEVDGALRSELADVAAEQLAAAKEVARVLVEPQTDTVAPATRSVDEPAGPEPAPEVVEVVEVVEVPPAPVIPCEPPCRTPEEVEAAALAAVERFRARQAAGIVPEPPDPSARPPRVVVRYAAPGRYCLARCYCGTCPQYERQRAEADHAYRLTLADARNKR